MTWCQKQGGAAEGREGLGGRAAGAGSRAPTAPESSQSGFCRHLSLGATGHLVLLSITVLPQFLAAQEHPRRKYNHTCQCSFSYTCIHKKKLHSHAERLDYTPATATGKSKLNVSWLQWLLFPRQAWNKRVTSAKRC